jgi:hypothetical protein
LPEAIAAACPSALLVAFEVPAGRAAGVTAPPASFVAANLVSVWLWPPLFTTVPDRGRVILASIAAEGRASTGAGCPFAVEIVFAGEVAASAAAVATGSVAGTTAVMSGSATATSAASTGDSEAIGAGEAASATYAIAVDTESGGAESVAG